MTDLVERYVYQVGKYLPEKEREEVQNELRSLLYDQLDDRYKGAPTQDDVVELLTEFGEPRQMAASYGREQYLIGPDLYPAMIYVLQRGLLWVPIIVVAVRVVVAFAAGEPGTLFGLFLETLFTVVQAVFVFSGIVVILFALMQYTGFDIEEHKTAFNPLDLPRVDDPAAVDRGEIAAGIAFNTFWLFLLIYFLRVGGLTLRFNLTEPVDVIPVPTNWLIVYIVATVGMIIISILTLRRGRWSAPLLLAEMGLEVLTAFAGYFVILIPLFDWLFAAVPALMNLPFAENAPLITAVFFGFLTLVDTFSKLVKTVFGGRDMPSISMNLES